MKYKILILIVILILTIFLLIGLYCGLTVKYYNIESSLINSNIKIALITDLHSCYYGKNMRTLTNAVNKEKPDIIRW